MRLAAMILAGGRSQRMGRPKESLDFGGRSLLGWIAAALGSCADPLLVVQRDAEQTLPTLPERVEVIHDDPPAGGPLAAIAAGLAHLRDAHGFAATDAAFVTGCDSPFLRGADVRWLADRLGDHQAVMPRANGILQPLCAIYRIAVLPDVERLRAQDIRSPRSLAEACRARLLDDAELAAHDPALRLLRNVNTPADYERARADFAATEPR